MGVRARGEGGVLSMTYKLLCAIKLWGGGGGGRMVVFLGVWGGGEDGFFGGV